MNVAAPITPLQVPLIARRTRAYFAPVNRFNGQPAPFDPALSDAWLSDAPPSPWIDLGWIYNLVRTSTSKIATVNTGSPSTVRTQVRTDLGATVSCSFANWTKLTMALTSGSEHLNVLTSASPGVYGTKGVQTLAALNLQPNSTATTLYLHSTAASTIAPGSIVVVDDDYSGQIGFVGAGVSAAYVQSPAYAGIDIDYIRRVSFNVARVVSIANDGGLQLATPLIAGVPSATMKVQCSLGFVDREGGSFFQEWSSLFLVEGMQGETLFFYYPRLQAYESAKEIEVPFASSIHALQLHGNFRALPVLDNQDGQAVLCYRFFCPAVYTYT